MAAKDGKPEIGAVTTVPVGRTAVVSGDAPADGKPTSAALDVSCDGTAEAVLLERPRDMPLLASPARVPVSGR